METFKQEHPGEGAEILLRWSRNASECGQGITLPESLTEETFAALIDRLEFAGPGFRTLLLFGLAAVAAQENEKNSDALLDWLSESLGDRPEFPGYRDSATIYLIALGMIAEPRVASWLQRGGTFEDALLREVAEKVIESRRSESIGALASFFRESGRDDLLMEMADLCALSGSAAESLEIIRALAPDGIKDKALSHFVSYRLACFSPEQIDSFEALFPNQDLNETGLKVSRAGALIEADRIDEATALLEGDSQNHYLQLSALACRRTAAEMDAGNFEKGLAICDCLKGTVTCNSRQRTEWTNQILDQYDLEEAVSLALRLPHHETVTRPTVAAALVERGEIERAEAVAEAAKGDLDKVAVFLEMLKATRPKLELRERTATWLAIVENTLSEIPPLESFRSEFLYGKIKKERRWLVERWHRGDREPLESLITDSLARRDEMLAAEDPDDDESDTLLTASVGVALAETRQYERLVPMLTRLYREDDLGHIAAAVFENWEPETACEELIRLCRDPEDFGQRKLLAELTASLAEAGDVTRAAALARHLRDCFEDEDGLESLARILRDRGDYEGARSMGGVPWWRRLSDREPWKFTIGEDDVDGRDWVRAVKNWEDSPEWLARYGRFGRAREAVEGLIRFHFQHLLPWWLTKTDDEPEPNYPQDFPGICRRAREEAKYYLWLEGSGPAPRTPWDITLAIWKIEALSWVLDRFAGTRINATEKQIMRELEEKQAAARKRLAHEVPAALKMPPGNDRIQALCDLAEIVSRHDEVTAPEDLIASLRHDAKRLANRAGTGDPEEEKIRTQLAMAMLQAGDAGAAAEAWPGDPGESRVRELAEKVRKEDWPQVAPLCRANPLAAAVLAAKLAKWYPKAGIRIG